MTLRPVWETVHVVATLVAPWTLAVWYFVPRGDTQTLVDEWQFVHVFHSVAAVAAGVLLCSSAMLRAGGRAVAASIPFTIFWAPALAAALYEVHEFRGRLRCGAELCMPSFGLFLTAVPVAFLVTIGVLGSMTAKRSHDESRASDDADGELPRYP